MVVAITKAEAFTQLMFIENFYFMLIETFEGTATQKWLLKATRCRRGRKGNEIRYRGRKD